MADGLQIRDSVKPETKRIIKTHAARRGIKVGEALNELVKAGAAAVEGQQQ